ncbi:hypothetical protein CEUSTIGMA_g7455.t1 [Chlamydomonas eustigma]|uniref:CRAL-TRIO domain-containing protein n=1 Tax=Chlamydomonas eustigma TaxID=1157962 RepID=A0A250XAF0_9CHLO|nr:hypothetical protein CEUSTIGMA_g7455.t1 [Chlamydomonas eustigma]|eukprot:GAX80016.1 hypothetical protein CEUSTIGMA_g7455.t1 [Chlamydomonas eustigma]
MSNTPERNIACLVDTHKFNISSLKANLQGEGILVDQYDDIWLLRFILSAKGDIIKAEKNIRLTLKWRAEKKLWLQAAKEGLPPPTPNFELFAKNIASDVYGRTVDGDMINIVRAGFANPRAVLNIASVEETVDYLMYCRELLFLRCDEETRRTGRLCKAVNVFDLNSFSLSKVHAKFGQVAAKSSKLSEICYPQVIDTQVIINMSGFLMAFVRLLRGLLSSGSQAKLKLCPGITLQDDISKCPFVRMRVALSSLPEFLGGTFSQPCSKVVLNQDQGDRSQEDLKCNMIQSARSEGQPEGDDSSPLDDFKSLKTISTGPC